MLTVEVIFADFLIAMYGDDLKQCPSQDQVTVLRNLATKLRIHSVKMTAVSKSGHPTFCISMAELMSVLFFRVMMYKDPRVFTVLGAEAAFR